MTGIFSVFGVFFVDWGGCVTKPDAENEVKPGVRQGTSLGKGTKAVSRCETFPQALISLLQITLLARQR